MGFNYSKRGASQPSHLIQEARPLENRGHLLKSRELPYLATQSEFQGNSDYAPHGARLGARAPCGARPGEAPRSGSRPGEGRVSLGHSNDCLAVLLALEFL